MLIILIVIVVHLFGRLKKFSDASLIGSLIQRSRQEADITKSIDISDPSNMQDITQEPKDEESPAKLKEIEDAATIDEEKL